MAKSKAKGNRGELEIVKTLNNRFDHLPLDLGRFSRSVGSGNRYSQAVLSKQAAETFGGDITSPEGFRWCLESKCGYDHLDLGKLTEGKNKVLDGFLGQAVDDAVRTNRKPALILRQNHKKPVVFVKSHDLPSNQFHYRFHYGDWVGINLENWLKILEDSYFFEHSNSI